MNLADTTIHPVDLHVGRRLAERRIGLGLSQADLGQALGLSFQQVQKYEKAANRISASKLWLAAACLHVDIGYFFTGLAPGLQGLSEPAAAGFDYGFPVTRHAVAIAKLAPKLSSSQQRLIATLMREMADDPTKG